MGSYVGPVVLEIPGQSFVLRVEINDTQDPAWEAVFDPAVLLPPEVTEGKSFDVFIADGDDDRLGMVAECRLDLTSERPILRGTGRFEAP